jgi:hypothetical protein
MIMKTFLLIALCISYVSGHAGIIDPPASVDAGAEVCNSANWIATGDPVCGIAAPGGNYLFTADAVCATTGVFSFGGTATQTELVVDTAADAFVVQVFQAVAHYNINNTYTFSLLDGLTGQEVTDIFGVTFPMTFTQDTITGADADEVVLDIDMGIIDGDMVINFGAYIMVMTFDASAGGGGVYVSCSAFSRRNQNDVDVCQAEFPGTTACCLPTTGVSTFCDADSFATPSWSCVYDFGFGFTPIDVSTSYTQAGFDASQSSTAEDQLCPENPGFIKDCNFVAPTKQEYCEMPDCGTSAQDECAELLSEPICMDDCLKCFTQATCDVIAQATTSTGTCSTPFQDAHDELDSNGDCQAPNTNTGNTDTGTGNTNTGTGNTNTGNTGNTDTGTGNTNTGTGNTDTGTGNTNTGTGNTNTGNTDTGTGTGTGNGNTDADTASSSSCVVVGLVSIVALLMN